MLVCFSWIFPPSWIISNISISTKEIESHLLSLAYRLVNRKNEKFARFGAQKVEILFVCHIFASTRNQSSRLMFETLFDTVTSARIRKFLLKESRKHATSLKRPKTFLVNMLSWSHNTKQEASCIPSQSPFTQKSVSSKLILNVVHDSKRKSFSFGWLILAQGCWICWYCDFQPQATSLQMIFDLLILILNAY